MTTKKTKGDSDKDEMESSPILNAAKSLDKGLSAAKKKITEGFSHSDHQSSSSSLIATLFDFTFHDFIAISVIKFIYGIGILALALGAVVQTYMAFKMSTGAGFGMLLIGAPLGFLLSLLLLRVALEGIIVIFRIGENIQKIADGDAGK